MNDQYGLKNIFKIFFQWKKTILIPVLVVTIGVSAIVFPMPYYYKSQSIFLPYNLRNFDPKHILMETPTDIFGGSQDIDRILAIAGSMPLLEHLIRKFNLYERYDIDTTKNKFRSIVTRQLLGNYKAIKGERGGIEISILDTDPVIAAHMVQEVIKYIDSVNMYSIRLNQNKYFTILKSGLDMRYKQFDSISRSFQKMKTIDVENIYKADKSLTFHDIDLKLTNHLSTLIEMRTRYEQVSSILKEETKSIFIIQPPCVPEEEEKPFKSLIIFGAGFLTFFFTLLSLLFIDYYKEEISDLQEKKVE